jgi:hypothetical protein
MAAGPAVAGMLAHLGPSMKSDRRRPPGVHRSWRLSVEEKRPYCGRHIAIQRLRHDE